MNIFLKKIPNILTCTRILCIPIIVFMMYINTNYTNCIAVIFTFIACISDFLDGRLARKYNCCSAFGKCMDPIADKVLVMSLILSLLYQHKVWLSPCVIILFREFVVSGIREFASRESQVIIHVSKLAKWKTTTQMFSLFILIVFKVDSNLNIIGNLLLVVAAILSIITCIQYIISVKHIIFSNF